MKIYKILLSVCFIAAFLAACGNADTDRLHPVLKDGKWGYIDYQGKIVIEPQFQKAADFSDGLARVNIINPGNTIHTTKFGFIDRTGKFVIEPQFSWNDLYQPSVQKDLGSFSFNDNLGMIKTETMYETIFIDKTGKTIFKFDPSPVRLVMGNFSDGLVLVYGYEEDKDKPYAFYDTSGKVAFRTGAFKIEPFREGLARIGALDDTWGFIDKTGNTVIEPQFRRAFDFSEGLARIATAADKYGFVDKTGKMIIEPKFDAAEDFHEGLAAVRRGVVWGYIDKTGKWAIEPKFSGLTPGDFSEGLALVFQDSIWQIIDKSGKTVAALDAAIGLEKTGSIDARKFQGGLARIIHTFEDGEVRIIYANKKGETVWNEIGKVAESKN